jgi:hypothetical protein
MSAPVLHLRCGDHPSAGNRGLVPTECGSWVQRSETTNTPPDVTCADCLRVIADDVKAAADFCPACGLILLEDTHAPYCSRRCAVWAEMDGRR